MGQRKLQTVGDVVWAEGNLLARCGRATCSHRSVIDARQLARRAHVLVWNTSLPALAARLRCTACGHLGGYLTPVLEEVTGRRVGPTSNEEAKALIKLLRG